ncbi:DUF2254 domain-containing protein [Devosia nitrariae]|uniref:DUF2254 domain-containing protein n=1 Tax=Devosia nitrariae TaxID=2071872 RepID=UPI0024E05581|nr:DUF2254 domain-containing protein [Devosia nitrariae]
MSQISFHLHQMVRRMWFLPATFSLLAIVTITVAYGVAKFVPDRMPLEMPSDAIRSILTILASSLLTVAVFALSTMVTALSTASQVTTPRAVPLIVEDRTAQTSISVFIGAFLFAILGIIALSAGIYSQAGRLVLFLVTLGMVVLVTVALIRWIGQISAIGRVAETIDKVEAATAKGFHTVDEPPLMGCRPQTGGPKGKAISCATIGYIQHIDLANLQDAAERLDVVVDVMARPGAYVFPGRALALVERELPEEETERLADCFVVGDTRTFDSDPRFGLIVLNEIASRALSPGINDSGTAIDVIGTQVRILADWACLERNGDVLFERLTITPLTVADLMVDAFRPIARDGAGQIEVVLRLLAGLHTLSGIPLLASEARATARDVEARAMTALLAASDRQALASAAAFAH